MRRIAKTSGVRRKCQGGGKLRISYGVAYEFEKKNEAFDIPFIIIMDKIGKKIFY